MADEETPQEDDIPHAKALVPAKRQSRRSPTDHTTIKFKAITGGVTGSRSLQNEERDAEIFERKVRGQSLWDIAREMHITQTTVRAVLQRRFDRRLAPLIDELRDVQNEQLDRLVRTLWKRAVEEGSLPHIDRMLKVFERQAKLNGLDLAPNVNVDNRQITINVGEMTPEQIRALASMRTSEEAVEGEFEEMED